MVCCLDIVIISSSFSRFLSDWVSEVCLYEDWHYNNEKKKSCPMPVICRSLRDGHSLSLLVISGKEEGWNIMICR